MAIVKANPNLTLFRDLTKFRNIVTKSFGHRTQFLLAIFFQGGWDIHFCSGQFCFRRLYMSFCHLVAGSILRQSLLWKSMLWKSILWKSILWKSILWKSILWKSMLWKSILWKSILWKFFWILFDKKVI